MNKTGQLNTRMIEDVNKVHDGTGDKIGSALQFFSGFLAGLILGYIEYTVSIQFHSLDLDSLKDGN